MNKIEITVEYHTYTGNGIWKPLEALTAGSLFVLSRYDREVLEAFPANCISASVRAEFIVPADDDSKNIGCYTIASRDVTFPDRDGVPVWKDCTPSLEKQAKQFIYSTKSGHTRCYQEHAKYLKGKLLAHQLPASSVWQEVLKIAQGEQQ